MAAPTQYNRITSFALFTAENPGEPAPGNLYDAEYNALKVALDETQANLALIQDDDGALKRGSVGRAQFDSSIDLGFGPPSPWTADTLYDADVDTVFHGQKFYIANEDHTSTDTFDESKWTELADFSATNLLDDGSVTTAKIADEAVTGAKMPDGVIVAAKLATSSVTTTKIADSNVTTTKIAANAVTSDKVDSSVWSTGDIKLTTKTAADTGWLMFDDTTFGDALSGATHAGPEYENLFLLWFANISDTYAPVLTSAGGATTRAAQGSAAGAWSAHCRMSVLKVLGRALAIAGSGSGLSARTLGQTAGTETITLDSSVIPAHAHGVTDPGHAHSATPTYGADNYYATGQGGGGGNAMLGAPIGIAVASNTTGISIQNTGGGGAHGNVQPTTFLKAMVKL